LHKIELWSFNPITLLESYRRRPVSRDSENLDAGFHRHDDKSNHSYRKLSKSK